MGCATRPAKTNRRDRMSVNRRPFTNFEAGMQQIARGRIEQRRAAAEGSKNATHQELLPPMPMTERGEQVMPTETLGPRTIPNRPRMSFATGSLEVATLLQHCTGPVEHEDGEPEGWCLRAARETHGH